MGGLWNGKVYKLNLYTIYWASNNYYLIGSHDNHDGLTHYRLDRILNLCISEEYAIDAKEKVGPNPESYIQNYIEESVNHFSGEVVRIEVEYKPDPVTNAILYDFAGKDIKVYKQEVSFVNLIDAIIVKLFNAITVQFSQISQWK